MPISPYDPALAQLIAVDHPTPEKVAAAHMTLGDLYATKVATDHS